MEFLDGTVLIGIATLDGNGNATFSLDDLEAGSHTITVDYCCDDNFNVSTSGSVTVQVSPAALTVTASDVTMTYADGTTLDDFTGFTSSGLQGSDAIDSVSLAANATTSTSDNWNAGEAGP